MRRRGRDERGQGTVEYAALVVLVAVVFAGLVALTSGGVGSAVLRGLQRGLCLIAPSACPTPAADFDELPACPLRRTQRGERLRETVAVVRLATGRSLAEIHHSDGRVTVTLSDDDSVGLEVGVGLAVARARAQVTAGADLVWGSGRAWTFPNAAAARRFIDRYGGKATVRGELLDQVRSRCSVLCDAIGWRPHPELPEPDERYEQGGDLGRVVAELSLGRLRARGEGGAGRVVGSRIRRDGERTEYVRVDGALGATLTASALVLGGEGARRTVLSVRRAADGRPLELGVHTVVERSGTAHLGGNATVARAAGSGGAGRRVGEVVERDATLDLTDPAVRAEVAALLAGLDGEDGDGRRAADALRARIERDARIDERRYVATSDATSIGAEVGVGVRLGGAFERDASGLRIVDARTRLPGLPFLPRDDCRAG